MVLYNKKINEGLFFATFSFVFWGLCPIYFKSIDTVFAFEILAHRIVWSLIFLILIVFITKEFANIKIVFQNRKHLLMLFLSSILIGGNWFLYIWAVNSDKMIEASLGYYINPLVTMALGCIFFGDRPTKIGLVAICLVVCAVGFEVFSIGKLPLVSVGLALLFAFYALVRKKLPVGSLSGLYVETALLFPFALGYLIYISVNGSGSFGAKLDVSLLLILAGPVTVLPLLSFASAASRLSLSTLSYFQYLGPSIALLVAIFIYDEPFSTDKLITFSIIWFALILISVDSYMRRRASK